jgi:hypothetical protein
MERPKVGLVPRLLLATALVGAVAYYRDGSSVHAAGEQQPTPITTPDTLGIGTHLGQILFINNGTSTVEAQSLAAQVTATPTYATRLEVLMPVVSQESISPKKTPTPTVETDDSEERARKNRGNTNRRLREEQKNDAKDKSQRGKNNQNNSRNVENNNDNDQNFPTNNSNDNEENFCGQALTTGYNPQTGETKVFPTTCLPDGWVRIESRRETPTPTVTATQTPTSIIFCPAEFPSRCGTPQKRP